MRVDQIKALKAAALTGFLEAAKAIPVAGDFIAAGGEAVTAYMDAIEEMKDLPEAARGAIEALEGDYRRMLARESVPYREGKEDTLELAMLATLKIVTQYGLSAGELVNKAGLDATKAARLALDRGAVVLDELYDTDARALTRRLVGAYYVILLEHKDAFDFVAFEGLKTLLERSAELERRIPADLDSMLKAISAKLDRLGAGERPRPPVNLPAASETFVGREGEMARLMERLDQDKGGVALIAGVRGMGGVGKTELALQAAHRLAHRYPARLFIDAGERDADALLAEIIRLFQPERKPPDDAAARASLARQLMNRWPGLLILDNVTRPEGVRAVLEGSLAAGPWWSPRGVNSACVAGCCWI